MKEELTLFSVSELGTYYPLRELLTLMRHSKKTQKKGPLVAVDIGSSEIRAMAAVPDAEGILSITGLETISKPRSMEKGIIVNSTEVGGAIRNILHLLRNRIGMRSDELIPSVFVSVGGKSLQSAIVEVSRDLLVPSQISEKRYEEMAVECKSKMEKAYPNIVVLHAEPIMYILDGEAQWDKPDDYQRVRRITIHYNVFICLRDCWDKVKGSLDRAGVVAESSFAKPDAHLAALCTEKELEEGVAIIDLGHQTTTLSIYKDGAFRRTVVNPLGGYHITRDIQDQQISFEMAEKAKTLYGRAIEANVTQNKNITARNEKNPTEKVQLSFSLLAHIIQARQEEILEPLMSRLNTFLETEMLGKLYITGGGAMLADIAELVQSMTPLPVEYGSHADWLALDTEEEYYKPCYSALIGTLVMGSEYRLTHKDEELPTNIFASTREGVEKRILDLFTDDQQN